MSNFKQEHQSPFDKFEAKENQTPNVAEQVEEPKFYLDQEIQPFLNNEPPNNNAIALELYEQYLAAWQETNTKTSHFDTDKAVLALEQHEESFTNKLLENAQVKADSSFRSTLNSTYLNNLYDLPDFFLAAWDRIETELKKDLVTNKTTWNNVSNSALNLVRQELAKSVQCYIDERLKELAVIQEQAIKTRIDAEVEVKVTQKLRKKIEYVLAEEERLEQAQREQEQAERRDKQMRDRWKYWFYVAARLRNIIAFLLLWGAICFYWGGSSIDTPKVVHCSKR